MDIKLSQGVFCMCKGGWISLYPYTLTEYLFEISTI